MFTHGLSKTRSPENIFSSTIMRWAEFYYWITACYWDYGWKIHFSNEFEPNSWSRMFQMEKGKIWLSCSRTNVLIPQCDRLRYPTDEWIQVGRNILKLKSQSELQPKALDNNTRPTNPGIGCGTFLVCPDILMLSLPRHRHVPDWRGLLGDAKLIIATRPLIYIASTGALYSTGIVRTRTLWERRTWTPHIREGKSKWN